MIKVGITGRKGFIGSHLFETLNLNKNEFVIIDFHRSYFDDELLLDSFVTKCDVIVHLAALNRHNDPNTIYETNTELVQKLIAALERTNSKIHLIVASSTQEERDNLYGKSKKESRLLLSKWANNKGGSLTGLIIPNVFGPFGRPFYNSVISTFCHQISRGENPIIEVDGNLNLIYVGDLVDKIIKLIISRENIHELKVEHTAEAKVSEILSLLNSYREIYQDKGEIPYLKNEFEHKLFNTYRCFMDIPNYFPRNFLRHEDDRGAFVEIVRQGIGGQTSFSTTLPEVTRGNHFHTRKIERFAVIKGKALIQLRRIGTEDIYNFYLDGNQPSYVDMPIWYTHNIKNISEEVLYTIFWINEPYDINNPDTYLEKV